MDADADVDVDANVPPPVSDRFAIEGYVAAAVKVVGRIVPGPGLFTLFKANEEFVAAAAARNCAGLVIAVGVAKFMFMFIIGASIPMAATPGFAAKKLFVCCKCCNAAAFCCMMAAFCCKIKS